MGIELTQLQMTGKVSRKLSREEAKGKVLDLIDQIGMTPAKSDFLYVNTDLGSTFCQIIMESHIIGKYIGNYLDLEILSCKSFPVERAVEIAKKYFAYDEEPKTYMSNRGVELCLKKK